MWKNGYHVYVNVYKYVGIILNNKEKQADITYLQPVQYGEKPNGEKWEVTPITSIIEER